MHCRKVLKFGAGVWNWALSGPQFGRGIGHFPARDLEVCFSNWALAGPQSGNSAQKNAWPVLKFGVPTITGLMLKFGHWLARNLEVKLKIWPKKWCLAGNWSANWNSALLELASKAGKILTNGERGRKI